MITSSTDKVHLKKKKILFVTSSIRLSLLAMLKELLDLIESHSNRGFHIRKNCVPFGCRNAGSRLQTAQLMFEYVMLVFVLVTGIRENWSESCFQPSFES